MPHAPERNSGVFPGKIAQALWLLVFPGMALAAPIYDVRAVGPVGYTSGAAAVNGAGEVAGSFQMPDGTSRAFAWRNGAVEVLPVPEGAAQTWALAISGSGQAGGYMDGASNLFGVVWDKPAGINTLGSGFVMGLNAAGDAAGLFLTPDGMGAAFITHNGQVQMLDQPSGSSWSAANGINASGASAGSVMVGGLFSAFRADESGQVAVLNGLGGANSHARAINGAGQVAGHAQSPDGRFQAVRWTGATPLGLGTLGGMNSYAYGIDANGRVIGYSGLGNGETAAFLFEDGFMYDLNGLLAPGSGWQLLAAYGINDSGQIAGTGIYNGVEQAFLLTPRPPSELFAAPAAAASVPEPGALRLIVPALLAILLLRSRIL
jgi:probable HAF family extracellular repeat protein